MTWMLMILFLTVLHPVPTSAFPKSHDFNTPISFPPPFPSFHLGQIFACTVVIPVYEPGPTFGG